MLYKNKKNIDVLISKAYPTKKQRGKDLIFQSLLILFFISNRQSFIQNVIRIGLKILKKS
ncbi:MAG: hypothetical protein CVU46_04375 [Chloroflexi bacterium HGW-Chloroflexi-8]|nr:MAG: hypothetical protein CVU46_04375 [Chloroflexi bacterium HGW-Chloroflexi-8]